MKGAFPIEQHKPMFELLTRKIEAGISIFMMVSSYIVAQAGVIQQGFDELFSLGLLLVAVVVIWKAFNKKDDSETKLLEEKVSIYKELIDEKRQIVEEMQKHKNEIESQRDEFARRVNQLEEELKSVIKDEN